MPDDLRARLEAALELHTCNGYLVDAELGDVLDAVMAVIRPPREGCAPYCEGGHGNAVTCAQVATWRRDSARDPWRCWHTPHDGRPLHTFGDQDECLNDGCGARLSDLRNALDARRGSKVERQDVP